MRICSANSTTCWVPPTTDRHGGFGPCFLEIVMDEILRRCGVSGPLFGELVGASAVYVWYWRNGRRKFQGKKGQKAVKLMELLIEASNAGYLTADVRATKNSVVAAIRQLQADRK